MAEQLRMFMTPHEILKEYKPNPADLHYLDDDPYASTDENADRDRYETEDELWDRKAEEADESGLTDSIMAHGVKMPISLDPASRTIRGGHHRLIIANHLSPHQFIPVMHVGSVKEAKKAEADISRNANDADVTSRWNW